MSRSGFWRFDRERLLPILFEHGSRRFSVFVLLISNAAVKTMTLKHEAGDVDLRRGDVAFSQRQIAREMNESLSTVHREIHRLADAGLISLREVKRQVKRQVERVEVSEVKHPLTVATITDYKAYSFAADVSETGLSERHETRSETRSGTEERTYKKEELEKKEIARHRFEDPDPEKVRRIVDVFPKECQDELTPALVGDWLREHHDDDAHLIKLLRPHTRQKLGYLCKVVHDPKNTRAAQEAAAAKRKSATPATQPKVDPSDKPRSRRTAADFGAEIWKPTAAAGGERR